MFKKMLVLLLVFSFVFSAAAYAASSGDYDGSFYNDVMTIDTITVNNGRMTVDNNTSNINTREFEIQAMTQRWWGWTNERTLMTVTSDGSQFFSVDQLPNDDYKLRFIRTDNGNCGGTDCGTINVVGEFWNP